MATREELYEKYKSKIEEIENCRYAKDIREQEKSLNQEFCNDSDLKEHCQSLVGKYILVSTNYRDYFYRIQSFEISKFGNLDLYGSAIYKHHEEDIEYQSFYECDIMSFDICRYLKDDLHFISREEYSSAFKDLISELSYKLGEHIDGFDYKETGKFHVKVEGQNDQSNMNTAPNPF
jgi:hypothetical protein